MSALVLVLLLQLGHADTTRATAPELSPAERAAGLTALRRFTIAVEVILVPTLSVLIYRSHKRDFPRKPKEPKS